jgi:hypothetical protein
MAKIIFLFFLTLTFEPVFSQSLSQKVVNIVLNDKGIINRKIGIRSETVNNVDIYALFPFKSDSVIQFNFNDIDKNLLIDDDSLASEMLVIPKKRQCDRLTQCLSLSKPFKIGQLNCVYAKLIYKGETGGVRFLFIFNDRNEYLGFRTSQFVY